MDSIQGGASLPCANLKKKTLVRKPIPYLRENRQKAKAYELSISI